jgi:hydroxymethylglutaryl-CoA lyase
MSLPRYVTICDVGPRDGLQNEQVTLTTEAKLALLQALVAAGLTEIEVGSFVSPKWVPQMADTDQVLARAPGPPAVRRRVLVPNLRGTERAIAAGLAEELCFSVMASETYNQRNWGAPIEATLEQIARSVERVKALPKPPRLMGNIGATFGCAYEGEVPLDRVLRLVEYYVVQGFGGVNLADSVGMGNPEQVKRVITAVRDRWPDLALTLHFHNTRGLGLANMYAALELGVDRFDASVGGMGGCPFAPNAAGNICTEDAVHMLHAMGIETGIDLGRLVEAARLAERLLGHRLPGMLYRIGGA